MLKFFSSCFYGFFTILFQDVDIFSIGNLCIKVEELPIVNRRYPLPPHSQKCIYVNHYLPGHKIKWNNNAKMKFEMAPQRNIRRTLADHRGIMLLRHRQLFPIHYHVSYIIFRTCVAHSKWLYFMNKDIWIY